MSEVLWHYNEMGSVEQAKRLENRYMGVTREQYIEKTYCEKAVKKHKIPYTDSMEEARKAILGIYTYDYLKEKYPNRPTLWEDWEQHGWYEANNIYEMVLYDMSYMLFADDTHEPSPWYVKVVRHSQVYCGPEEGGTWGVDYEFIKWTCFDTKEKAYAFVKAYNAEAEKKKSTFKPNLEALGGDDTVSSNYPEGYIPKGWAASKGTCAFMCILPFTVPSSPYYYE